MKRAIFSLLCLGATGFAETAFQKGDMVIVTQDTPALFKQEAKATARRGEQIRVYSYDEAAARIYYIGKDEQGRAIGYNLDSAAVVKSADYPKFLETKFASFKGLRLGMRIAEVKELMRVSMWAPQYNLGGPWETENGIVFMQAAPLANPSIRDTPAISRALGDFLTLGTYTFEGETKKVQWWHAAVDFANGAVIRITISEFPRSANFIDQLKTEWVPTVLAVLISKYGKPTQQTDPAEINIFTFRNHPTVAKWSLPNDQTARLVLSEYDSEFTAEFVLEDTSAVKAARATDHITPGF